MKENESPSCLALNMNVLRTPSLWRRDEGVVDIFPINAWELLEATRIDDVNQMLTLTLPSS